MNDDVRQNTRHDSVSQDATMGKCIKMQLKIRVEKKGKKNENHIWMDGWSDDEMMEIH